MKTILAPLAVVTIFSVAACGAGGTRSSTVAGAPHQMDAVCESANGDVSLVIYEGKGILRNVDRLAVSFACKKVGGSTLGVGPAKLLWSCSEDRSGTGLSHVEVYSNGSTGAAEATVSVEQMFPLPNKTLATLTCQ